MKLWHTFMDMRTDLTAVPHASLRNPNPEKSRKGLENLGVFKRNGGQSLKSTTERQGDDARTCLPNEVLGLASRHSEEPENERYVRMISPNIPLCDLASLNWVSHRVPSSPAE